MSCRTPALRLYELLFLLSFLMVHMCDDTVLPFVWAMTLLLSTQSLVTNLCERGEVVRGDTRTDCFEQG